jgi:hypothetical protein
LVHSSTQSTGFACAGSVKTASGSSTVPSARSSVNRAIGWRAQAEISWRPVAARLPAAPPPTLPSPTTAMLKRRFCAPDAIVMASLIEATKESQMSRTPQQMKVPARADRGLTDTMRVEGYV